MNLRVRQQSTKGTFLLPAVLGLVVAVICLSYDSANAGSPEYMKLTYEIGNAFEIEGIWQEEGYLLATDIEPLPKPRRPKLRGRIQSIDSTAQTITVYGQALKIYKRTELIDEDSQDILGRLELNQLVEVSCKVDSTGTWFATKIRVKAVKNSNKIKGTLTRVQVDGNAPDTVEIDGLLIIFDRRTDVNRSSSHIDVAEDYLFGDLAAPTAWGNSDGYVYNDQLHIHGEYRQTTRSEGDFDLDNAFAANMSTTQPEARVKIQSYWSDVMRGAAKMRFRKKYIVTSDQNLPGYDFEAQVLELFLLAKNIGGKSIAFAVGRQDFDEPREWLFDEYLDAARLYYYGAEPLIFEIAYIDAVEPIKEKFATWTDVFAQARWLISKEAQASIYLLSRSDTDARNREPIWYGARYSGEISPRFQPWFDGAIMKGTDKGEDLDAWAIDLGTTIKGYDLVGSPSITVGYAIGSGDDTGSDNIDHAFRQTGYQDDVDEFGGASSIPYYGAVLGPELSNLKITTFGVSARPYRNSSVELIFHGYKQQHPDNDLKGSDLLEPPLGPAIPQGVNDDIGSALDIIVSFPTFWEPAQLAWTLGWFYPGEAFGPYQATASLSKFNLTVNF